MAEVRTSELHRWGGTHSCPVCIQPIKQPIELACTHVLCAGCAGKMSDHHFRKCPVCRHPHLLDPKLLKERSAAWRSAYGEWRAGKVRGAIGEVGSITRLKVMKEQPSQEQRATRAGESALMRALDLAEACGSEGKAGGSGKGKSRSGSPSKAARTGLQSRLKAPPAASKIPLPPAGWLQAQCGEGTSQGHAPPEGGGEHAPPLVPPLGRRVAL